MGRIDQFSGIKYNASKGLHFNNWLLLVWLWLNERSVQYSIKDLLCLKCNNSFLNFVNLNVQIIWKQIYNKFLNIIKQQYET